MKSFRKHIVALTLVFVTMFSLSFHAFADGNYSSKAVTWWDQYIYTNGFGLNVPFLDNAIKYVNSKLSKNLCAKSSDGLHWADYLSDEHGTDDHGIYRMAICKYCEKSFKVYGQDMKNAYDDYVKELPGTAVNKDGYFIPLVVESVDTSKFTGDSYMIVSGEGTNKISFTASSAPGMSTRFYFASCTAPVAGDYAFCFDPGSTQSLRICFPLTKTGNYRFAGVYYILPGMDMYPINYSYSPYISKAAGSAICSDGDYFYIKSGSERSASLAFYLYCKPAVLPDFVTDTTSRPSNITGNYGIIGDNGTISNITNNTIVNETNNTFTNPSTGETYEITNWSYDYSDRSYNLTLSTGDTVTVTYGDENITINQGDTIYNVYYIIQGSDVTPACQHDYQSTVTVEATCEAAGQLTYTCSKCGDSYTKTVPAKGHTWQVKQSVSTEYDDSGNVTQQGYTIYKCAVCGNEYKDEAGAGPPGKPDSGGDEDTGSLWSKLGSLIGSLLSGLLGMIQAVLGKILDALTSLAALIGEKLQGIVELVLSFFDAIPEMFSGFLGFLGAVFGFLPADILLLLTFGVAAVVFIGIIKALRR